MKPRHKHLLEDPDIRRWYNNVARGSVITADEKLRRIGRFCEATSHTPQSLIEFKKETPDDFDVFIMDFVDDCFAKGFKPSYVRNLLVGVKSWLGHFGLSIDRKIKLPVADYVEETVPTKEEFSQILRHCNPRARVVASLMGFAGLRPQSISNYEGTDGLRLKDLPDLKIEGDKVIIEDTPMRIIVRRTLSKARHQYMTFLIQEGSQYLIEYLESRLRDGEQLSPDSAVIGHYRPGTLDFLRTTKLAWEVKKAIKEAGFSWRPYILRSYCATSLDIAEARGLISHPWRQFFMGHKGDMEARYSTNKGRLPPDLIDEMRATFQRCEPFLSTAVIQMDETSVVKEAKIEAIKSLAKSLLDIDLTDVKIKKERELDRDLSQDETIELFEVEMKKLREEPNLQQIVDEEDLPNHLNHGWEFVSTLPSGKILVRR